MSNCVIWYLKRWVCRIDRQIYFKSTTHWGHAAHAAHANYKQTVMMPTRNENDSHALPFPRFLCCRCSCRRCTILCHRNPANWTLDAAMSSPSQTAPTRTGGTARSAIGKESSQQLMWRHIIHNKITAKDEGHALLSPQPDSISNCNNSKKNGTKHKF